MLTCRVATPEQSEAAHCQACFVRLLFSFRAKGAQSKPDITSHLRGKTTMRDEEIYFGFNSEKQKKYEKELIASGKTTTTQINESREKVKQWGKSDWDKYKNAHEKIGNAFANAIEKNIDPGSDEVQRLAKQHFDIVKNFWVPDKERYIGLGIMYVEHPEFQKFYERFHPKLPEYLSKAMKIFAERELT